MKVKRVMLVALGVIVALVLGVVVTGALLPADHVASRETTVKGTPDAVFAALTDVEKHGSWRSDVKKIELLPPDGAHRRWRETNSFGAIAMKEVEAEPSKKLVTAIDDPDLPFAGTWTYELAPEGADRTRVTITERGTVKNPIFRFMSRFVFGYTKTMDDFLKDLEKKFS